MRVGAGNGAAGVSPMPAMGSRGFILGTVVIYGLLLWLYLSRYATPDAISSATGVLLDAYLFGWILWVCAKGLSRSRPAPLRFIFVCACLSIAAYAYQELAVPA